LAIDFDCERNTTEWASAVHQMIALVILQDQRNWRRGGVTLGTPISMGSGCVLLSKQETCKHHSYNCYDA
jgi:hypothetical protein